MKLSNNKKGFFTGWEYVLGFFLVSIALVLIMGLYDFMIVEAYEPVHNILNDSFVELNKTTSLAYTGFVNNYDTVHSYNLPFNLLYIFIFFNSIIWSIINVAKQKKMSPMELIFKTIGGMIFFLYIMEIIVFKIITYFKVQFIDYLFQDLIISYIPFFNVVYDNSALIILIWGAVLILVNWYLGKTEQEFSGVFGQ